MKCSYCGGVVTEGVGDGKPTYHYGCYYKVIENEGRKEYSMSNKEILGGNAGQKPPQTTARARILDEAMAITHKDRNAVYGSAEDNFQQIANLWDAYLRARQSNACFIKGRPYSITPADVAVMCMLIKVARLAKSPSHHDSAVDIAGYAACLGEIQVKLRAAAEGLSVDVATGTISSVSDTVRKQGLGQEPGTEKF